MINLGIKNSTWEESARINLEKAVESLQINQEYLIVNINRLIIYFLIIIVNKCLMKLLNIL